MIISLKLILLSVLSFLIFNQLKRTSIENWKNLNLKNSWAFIFAIVLVFFNWFFEWLKWSLTLKTLKIKIESKFKFKSFLAGIATGLLTPNMLGNFIGRMFYFKRSQRIQIIILTLFSNFSQFLASILFGFFSVLLLNEIPFNFSSVWIEIILLLFTSTAICSFLFFDKINIPFIHRNKYFRRLTLVISQNKYFRIKTILFSLIRHFVFTLQFWLLLYSFIPTINIDIFFWIWQIFLWTTLIPSIWAGKIVIRESMALLVLTPLQLPAEIILTCSIFLWVINLVIPSVLSIFICKKTDFVE